MTYDDERSLEEAGLLSGSEYHNCLKIIPPKAISPPSIVISLANKAEESCDSLARPSRSRRYEKRRKLL